MNSFRKYNGVWTVQVMTGATTGDTVTVTLRNGGTKQVLLGDRLAFADAPLFAVATPAAQAPRAGEQVGDLSPILAMFDRARQHLRRPAIVLEGFRVNVAGQRAREPGGLTILSLDRHWDARTGTERRKWLGRVTRAGVFEAAFGADPAIADRLRRFAADPVGEAAAYGRLHGSCCFCNQALSDERSTAVGYGPICADHFGLPWGTRAASAAPARTLGTARGTARSRARAANRTQPGDCDGTADYQAIARREERPVFAAAPTGTDGVLA